MIRTYHQILYAWLLLDSSADSGASLETVMLGDLCTAEDFIDEKHFPFVTPCL